MNKTKDKIEDLIDKGIPFPQIEKALGVSFEDVQEVHVELLKKIKNEK